MGHYTDDASSVRVDFFRPSGKWYTTEAVKWTGEWKGEVLIHDAFKKSLQDHFKADFEGNRPNRLSEMIAVCLDPYHQNEHPLMLMPGQWLQGGT